MREKKTIHMDTETKMAKHEDWTSLIGGMNDYVGSEWRWDAWLGGLCIKVG